MIRMRVGNGCVRGQGWAAKLHFEMLLRDAAIMCSGGRRDDDGMRGGGGWGA